MQQKELQLRQRQELTRHSSDSSIRAKTTACRFIVNISLIMQSSVDEKKREMLRGSS